MKSIYREDLNLRIVFKSGGPRRAQHRSAGLIIRDRNAG
jgi:hypothetical protein